MDYKITDDGIIVSQNCFDLAQTLDCGQAFRWSEREDGAFEGDFLNEHLVVSELRKGEFLFEGVSEEKFLSVWKEYFDFETDYEAIIKRLSEDETLAKACAFASVIRILRQDTWETLCSFIISQNNNIPRIKGIIDRLCRHYDERFPVAEELSAETPDSLAYLRSGFRAKYICDAASRTASGLTNLAAIASMPIGEARAALKQIKGVGPKVAECVLLFGMHRTEAFPVDVWIKRVLAEYYPNGFPEFAAQNAGIAQQYLFHYIRSISNRTE